MGTFSKDQKGFGATEMLMALVIIGLIAMAGWLVYRNHSKTQAAVKNNHSAHTNPAVNTPNSNQSQYATWKSFCSSYGGLCLKYPATWKLSQATFAPGQNANGQEVDTITSPSTSVAVSYMPSAQVSGVRRIESIKVVGVNPTATSDLKVYQLINQITGPPIQYAAEDFVTLTSAAHALNKANSPFSQGAVIANSAEPPYHQFTNPLRPGNIGQQLLSVNIGGFGPGINFFSSAQSAQDWFKTSEVVTAGQILASVTYAQ
jgi:prepilin-type N-terminal cleavage/methylation domain-containing protein